MQLALRADGLLERLALRLNLVPVPAAHALLGMATSRVVTAGQSLGVFAQLLEGPRSAQEVASACGLDPEGARLLLDALAALGHLDVKDGRYVVAGRARRWLDPASDRYVGDFVGFNVNQWEWWSQLEQVVRTGEPYAIHSWPDDDPRWEHYIRGLYDLARQSAPEVSAAVRVPRGASRLLDLAGGHGWFAAELCRRHPGLAATVIDLPGSARIGQAILEESGAAGSVQHVAGDMFSADLGGPNDVVLCFQIIHHLQPDQIRVLLQRVHEAMSPGGTLAILDTFARPAGTRPDQGALVGLHFFLTSGAAVYSHEQVRGWMGEAGFTGYRSRRLRRIPGQELVQGTRA